MHGSSSGDLRSPAPRSHSSESNLRILEVETFGRGGLIHYAHNLSRALAERGHEVTLVTTAAYELEGQDLPPNVQVRKVIGRWAPGKGKGGRGQGWPAVLGSLARKVEAVTDALRVAVLARRLRPDVVHLHCTNPASLVYHLFFRLLGQPLVATAHVVTPHEGIRWQGTIYGWIHRSCHLVVAHSEFDRQRLITEFRLEAERTVVIPHGEYGFFAGGLAESPGTVSDREASRQSFGLEEEDEVALFFGYLREYKGLDILFEAWEIVLRERPSARLLVAGDPVNLPESRREELRAWADRLGVVHRFGYVPFSEVERYFRAADMLVMPYRHISQSGVLYLALALGVPVVATRVGALPEVLQDGEDALLVPPENPQELARALGRAFEDPALRRRLAEGGQRVAEEHSWPAIARRTESAFARIPRRH